MALGSAAMSRTFSFLKALGDWLRPRTRTDLHRDSDSIALNSRQEAHNSVVDTSIPNCVADKQASLHRRTSRLAPVFTRCMQIECASGPVLGLDIAALDIDASSEHSS